MDNTSSFKDENTNNDLVNNILDVDWINEFEHDDRYYTMFYQEVIKSIKVSLLYINKNNEIVKISEQLLSLHTENKITKEELLGLVKNNEYMDAIKYRLVNILVYNMALNHDDLRHFLHSSSKYDFLTSLKTIDTYELQSTINCLQSVNNIFIIYNEDSQETKPKQMINNTKRVRFDVNTTHKKTKRRRN